MKSETFRLHDKFVKELKKKSGFNKKTTSKSLFENRNRNLNEDKLDMIQAELEAKFDELFPLDDEEDDE